MLMLSQNDKPDRFPSWVPNWTEEPLDGERPYLQASDLSFRASGQTRTRLLEVRAEGVLHVECAAVDRITYVTGAFAETYLLPVFILADEFFGKIAAYPTGEDIQRV